MEQLSERFRHAMSRQEMERRWGLLRREMEKQELDCLILHNYDNFLGGYTRYITDIPIGNYPSTVLFHREDETTYIGHGAPWTPSVPAGMSRGIGQALATPLMPTLAYTDSYMPRLVIDELKRRGYRRVGLVGESMIPASLCRMIHEELPQVELVNATTMVDRIKMIKSPEEIRKLREIVHIHDMIGAAVPTIFRPGRYEYEIAADIRKMGSDLGCEGLNVMLGTGPSENPGLMLPNMQHRQVEMGDNMLCLIELSGPGGYYAELMRMWTLGEPSQALQDATACAIECQNEVISRMKPGVNCAELLKVNNDFLTARGYGPEGRMFAHSQGLDMVERPAFSADETLTLEENMFFAVHPAAVTESVFGAVCDNFLVTANGVERITQTPHGVLCC
mgnify:CR=1 FL=1